MSNGVAEAWPVSGVRGPRPRPPEAPGRSLRIIPRVLRPRAIYAALCLLLFWRPLTIDTFYFRDLYLLFIPKRFFFADAIRNGLLPLWDPLTHGGQSFLAQPQSMFFHPSGVLYLLLPVLTAFNLAVVLHVLLAALAAYWLARVAGLETVPAFVCGTVFAFCGVTMSAASLLPTLFALPWIPLAIGLTHRALRDGRSIAPAAIAAAMPLFSAAAEVAGFLFLTLIVWVVAMRRRNVAAAALVIVFAIGLSAIQTLPATSVIAQSSRALTQTYERFTAWSVSPARLPELAVPRFFGQTDTLDRSRYWGSPHETDGYPYVLSIYFGVPVLLLAGFGVAHRGEVPTRALAALALLAIALSLGRHLPGFRFVYELPLVSVFRYPVKALVAALLPLSLLAACGVASLPLRRRALALTSATLGALALLAALALRAPAVAASFAKWFGFTPVDGATLSLSFLHAAVAALALAGAVMMKERRELAVAAVVLLDLVVAASTVNRFTGRDLFEPSPFASMTKELAGNGRFHSGPGELIVPAPDPDIVWQARWRLETLHSYTATAFGIPAVYHLDYDGLAPKRMADLSRVMARLPWQVRLGLLDRANVTVFATQDALSLPPSRARAVASVDAPNGPLRLYQLFGNARARFVSEAVLARDERQALRATVLSPDLSKVVLERDGGRAGRCGSAPVRLVRANVYELDAACDGYVVFAENHYDGWRSLVDGRVTPEVRADYAFTAVPVTRGRHVIERRYTPPRLLTGALVTLASAVLLALTAAFFSARRAAPSHRE